MDDNSPIRILIVDDHPVFREGLIALLEMEPGMLPVAQASNTIDAIKEFRRHQPDVTLMDLHLPGGGSGIDAIIAIQEEFREARVIVFTISDADGEIQRALRAGATAYVLKSSPKEELMEVIRSVHSGKRCVPPDVAAVLAEHVGEDQLTAREVDVLRLIQAGLRNKQVADRLSISETTVNFHIKNAVAKLHANDRTHAAIIAYQRGLL